MTSPQFPEPPPSLPETPSDKVQEYIARLCANKKRWQGVKIPERIQLLEECTAAILRVGERWVDAACRAKGIEASSPAVGEEWLGGPMTTIRNIRLLGDALKAGGQPKPPQITQHPNGQQIARVFPADLTDKILFTGFSAEVWLEPGKPASQGRIYREKTESSTAGDGKVSLVLGAGNVASIGPMDCLYKLFVEDEVVLLKTNPVNAYLGPFIEEAFAPLIRENVLCVVHGGAELGAHLTQHDDIDTIHITGSDKTHDCIVWGAPDEQASRKAEGRPNLQKEISSELGCVTPVLVVPGPWSNAELDYQAEHIAGMVSNNGSFNCNAAKVVVLAKDWELKEEFRRRFHRALSKVPARKAYYPGAQERYKTFMDAYPNAFPVSEGGAEVVPWTIIPDVPPRTGEFALINEAFCGVVAEVNIDAADAPEFLKKAVQFANTTVWGNLSCMMLVHPETQKLHDAHVQEAITDLRYGGIGVNCWAGLIYGLCVTTWGAYPGNSLEDIRSGRGTVHNTYLFDYPEKSVVRAPFVIRPKPVWAAGHRKLPQVAKRLTEFEADPSLLKLTRIIGNAIQA